MERRPPAFRLRPWRLPAIALATFAVLAGSASAATIVEFDVKNADGTAPAVLGTDADVSASDVLAVGVTEWTPNGWTGFAAASGWGSGILLDPTKYYEWTVTPDLGHEISFETLDLALFRGVNGGGHGAELWEIHASTDGFVASDLTLVDSSVLDISASGVDEQVPFLGLDITALGTQTGSVSFRLYGFDYTAASDFSGLGGDDDLSGGAPIFGTGTNLRIAGTVTPEPGTAGLVGIGLAGLGLRRHRRRRA